MTGKDFDCDVAIVGYGPVGQLLGALLGSQGHKVTIVERYAKLYPLPRAIRFDGEVMRMFQRLGIVDEITEEIIPVQRYQWFGADGEIILDLDSSAPHPSGWSREYAFFQPAIEAALDRAVRRNPTVTVEIGSSCEGVEQDEDGVVLTLRRGTEPGAAPPAGEVSTLRARYVVGADGANSLVRDAVGIEVDDLGFKEHWLVADVRPHDMTQFAHLPDAAQRCDPRRPTAVVRNGGRHRRWEFMLLEGEQPSDFTTPESVWKLLEPYITPDDGVLIRSAVYQFGSALAKSMRADRVLLAGDAAHLMPPFMGEGMCSGLRDANNLTWRLDLILRGVSSETLFDTYTPERVHQNEHVIRVSMQMGGVACIVDPEAAAARDAAMRSGNVPPPPPMPGVGAGLVRADAGATPDPLAGELAVQGTVAADGRSGRFDDVLPRGFTLVCASGDPAALLGEERLRFVEEELGGAVVSLDREGTRGVSDLDGALTAWLAGHGVAAVLSRPDGYVFGSARQLDDVAPLVDDLREQLTTSSSVAA